MKREIYDKLKDKEKVLKNALNMDFIRLSASEFGWYADVYNENFNVQMTRGQMNCNTCRLKALKQLAKDYFDVALMYEKLEQEEQQIEQQQQTEQVEQTKKKRGRPRKIELE